MIKIECTKAEQLNLLMRLQMSDDCLFVEDMTVSCGVDTGISCDQCLRKNIRWIITDDENSKLLKFKCLYCEFETTNGSELIEHRVFCSKARNAETLK